MSWGYLSEFWNATTEVIVSGGTYTVDWFKSAGNAIAGAIGALFADLIHHFYDCLAIVLYLIDNLSNLFAIIFTPLTWIFNFVKGFFVSAFSTPIEPTITWVFNTEILANFQSIPYWNTFTYMLGAGIAILITAFIIKRLSGI